MRSTHRLAAWAKWRRACLRLVHPVSRNAATRVLRIAMAWGAVPVRRVEVSSLKVTSRTQWILFPMAPLVPAQEFSQLGGVSPVRCQAGGAAGDFLGAALVIEAADVADDPEQLGGVGEVDRHLVGHRYGALDTFLGAAVASVVLGVLDEVGPRSGQCLLRGGEQARLIVLM